MDPSKVKSRFAAKHDGAYYAVALDRTRGRLYAGSTDYSIHVFDLPKDKPPPKDVEVKKDAEKKNAEKKNADKKDTAKKDTAKKDTAKKDTAKKDTAKQAPAAAALKFEPVARWTRHENYVSALTFVERAGILVSGGYDGRLVWWEAGQATGAGTDRAGGEAPPARVADDLPSHKGWVRALAGTPDGTRVISAGD